MLYNPKLKKFARDLRTNMTEAEKFLWSKIRRKQIKGLQFYRQRIIGEYIVDFYCPKDGLVIKLDGGQHYTEEGRAKDRKREDYLKAQGLKIIRFSDKDVFENIQGVLETLLQEISNPP